MNRTLILASLLAGCVAGTALAQAPAAGTTPAPRPSFKQLDADGDGKLSRSEVASNPKLSQSFDSIDTNKDGFLSSDELRAGHRRHGQANVDTNGDGVISRDEAKSSPRLSQSFDAIDTNKDGNLTRDELAAWHKMSHSQPSPAVKP